MAIRPYYYYKNLSITTTIMLSSNQEKITSLTEYQEFLPPVNHWASFVGIFLAGAVGVGIALASSIKYNITVKASATVRPTGEIRIVQPEIEGTIKNILIQENQAVKLGDVIANLDNQQLLIKKSQLQSNLQQGKLQIFQINAQISSLDVQIEAEQRVIQQTVASAEADLVRNQRDYQERKITTQSEFQASKASQQKSEADLQKAQADLDFANVDRDRYQQLAQTGAVGRREFEARVLAVHQSISALKAAQKAVDIAKAKVQSASAAVNPTSATVKMAQERIIQETAKGDATIATLKKEKQALIQRRVETETQIQQNQKELQQLENQLDSSIIRATSNGIILKLYLRNPGQVVRTSDSLAEIAPNNTPLVIKAMIPIAEIKKVTTGKKVQLRFSACPHPDYGTLNGIVSTISPDAITPQNKNNDLANNSVNTSYFDVTIKPENLSFGRSNHKCHLQAGMGANVDIISQEETVLKFMLRKARLIADF